MGRDFFAATFYSRVREKSPFGWRVLALGEGGFASNVCLFVCLFVCRFVFVYGTSGSGKSSIARDFARAYYPVDSGACFYAKNISRWWDRYQGEPVVILDDPEPAPFRQLSELLKVWGDRYAFLAEVKGGTIQVNPEWFIVTANYSLAELCGGVGVFYDAMFRRANYGRRIFVFTEDEYYRCEDMPLPPEKRELFRRRLTDFADRIHQEELSVCYHTPLAGLPYSFVAASYMSSMNRVDSYCVILRAFHSWVGWVSCCARCNTHGLDGLVGLVGLVGLDGLVVVLGVILTG